MAEKVQAWKSSDGQLWNTELQALTRDFELAKDRTVEELEKYGIDWDIQALCQYAEDVGYILGPFIKMMQDFKRADLKANDG